MNECTSLHLAAQVGAECVQAGADFQLMTAVANDVSFPDSSKTLVSRGVCGEKLTNRARLPSCHFRNPFAALPCRPAVVRTWRRVRRGCL